MSKIFSNRAVITSVATAGLVFGAVAPVATAAPAETLAADTTTPVCGKFDWQVRESWVSYIHGIIANGHTLRTGHITKISGDNGQPSWTFNSKNVKINGNKVEIPIDGTLKFQGHKHGAGYILENTFSDIKLTIEGTDAKLVTDLQYREYNGQHTPGELKTIQDTVLSQWTLKKSITANDTKFEFESEGEGTFGENVHPAFIDKYKTPGQNKTAPLKGDVGISACAGAAAPDDDPAAFKNTDSSSKLKNLDFLGIFGKKDVNVFAIILTILGAAGGAALLGHVLMNNPWIKR